MLQCFDIKVSNISSTVRDILYILCLFHPLSVISTKENNRLTFYDMQNRMMPRTICFDLVIEQYNVRTKVHY